MTSAFSTLRASFSPLRIRNFRIYLGGQAISLIGTWLQVTAQGWVVWEITGSEAALGTVTLFNALPLLVLTPWAGVWADRLDRRKLLIATQAVAMLLAFILAFLTQTGLIQLWHIYGLALALGVITALDLPAQQAFLGDLAGMGEVRKAVNLNAMILQTSRMVGPALAGVMVARLGVAQAFWLNGLTFLAVIVSLMIVRANQVRSTGGHGSASPLAQMAEAVRFIRTQPRMQDMFMFATLLVFCFWSIVLNLLPSVADTILGGDASTFGALQAASGAGALVGVIFLAPLAQAQTRSGVVMALGALWLGAWAFVFSLSTTLPLSLFSLFAASLGAPVVFTMTLGLTQVMSPPDMRARLLSLFSMISFGMQPLAAVVVGFIAERFGVQTAMTINALIILAVSAGILLLRTEFRRWENTFKPAPVVVAEAT